MEDGESLVVYLTLVVATVLGPIVSCIFDVRRWALGMAIWGAVVFVTYACFYAAGPSQTPVADWGLVIPVAAAILMAVGFVRLATSPGPPQSGAAETPVSLSGPLVEWDPAATVLMSAIEHHPNITDQQNRDAGGSVDLLTKYIEKARTLPLTDHRHRVGAMKAELRSLRANVAHTDCGSALLALLRSRCEQMEGWQ